MDSSRALIAAQEAERTLDSMLLDAVRSNPDVYIALVEERPLTDLSRLVGVLARIRRDGLPPAWQTGSGQVGASGAGGESDG